MRKIFMLLASLCFCFGEEKIYATFEVLAKNSSKLAFESSGIVSSVNVDVSDTLKKGDVLARLENSSELIALQKAKNDLALAVTAKNFALNTLKKFEKVKDVTSKQNFDEAKFSYDKAALDEQSAKIAIKNIENILDKKQLKAPFDAVVVQKNVEVGEGVGAVMQSAFIINSSDSKLLIAIDEKFANAVKAGDRFIFKLDGEANEQSAEISLVYPIIEPKNRKFYSEAYVKGIKPGLFGEGYVVAK